MSRAWRSPETAETAETPEGGPWTVEAPWALDSDQVLAQLEVSGETGLDPDQARARAAEVGTNVLRGLEPRSAWTILVAQLRSVIVALLALGAGLSFAFDHPVEGVAIVAVLLINTTLGFFTELRARRSMESLRELGVTRAVVRRAGEVSRVRAEDLVPGDLMLIEGGDVIVADLRLIEASRVEADESALTGESVPVGKTLAALDPGTALAERTNMLFKGTIVTRGVGTGVVTATGHRTELGRIRDLVASVEDHETPLERRLDALGRRLMWASLGFALAIAGVGVATGRELMTMIETAIALAVATVPEGLPLVATLALARGMWRMARRHALIEQLAAVETLGSTTLILTDKTGTLTQNRMTVARLVVATSPVLEVDVAELGSARSSATELPPGLADLLEHAALCTDASLTEDSDGVGDPMELALLRAAGAAGFDLDDLEAARPKLREEAFDPKLKMMATIHAGPSAGLMVAVKGAPEAVLELCVLPAEAREDWLRRARALGEAGYRVLAVAEKQVETADAQPYVDLRLLGLIALEDPPRASVRGAVEALHRAGIRVVVVTGDHATTAQAIAKAVGVLADELEPEQVRRADAAPEALVRANVIARTSPEQKLELLSLYQAAGEVVAMIGDGINDAPALRQADIGVAMGQRGTEAAREAADVILLDDEFASIIVAIEQGRIIFDNVRKFVVYLISCNLSEISVVGLAALVGAPLPILPLQILYLNLVTDVFPALALGVSEGAPDVMDRRPRSPSEPLLPASHWRAIAGFAALLTVVVLTGFGVALTWLELDQASAVSVAFLTLALAQVVHVFNIVDPASHPLRNEVTRNPWVWGAVLVCVVLVLASVYFPGLSTVLRVRDPGLRGWLLVVGLSLAPVLVAQLIRLLRSAKPSRVEPARAARDQPVPAAKPPSRATPSTSSSAS